jgi:hypothetical protein
MMNDSNNNSDIKTKNAFKKSIDLLNSIILSLKNNPLKELEELSNEFKVYSLILEIEPKFEKTPINNRVELIQDSNLEIRYNNFNSIFTAVVNYKNESKTKDKFTKETNFINININGLLNNEKEQLIKILEMLCFLTIISSNKNYYIEKVNEIDDNQISNLYYTIIEKYITFKIDESTTSVVKKTNIFSNQLQNINSINTYNIKNENNIKFNELLLQERKEEPSDNTEKKKSINVSKAIIIKGYDTIIKESEEDINNRFIDNNDIFEQEKEKIKLQMKIDNLNKELTKMKEKYQNCEKDMKLLENNINELKEINNNLINCNIKEEQKINNKNIEEQNMIIKNLTQELKDANILIDNLKNENEQLHNTIKQINNEKQILEMQKDKFNMDLHQLQKENEHIKEEQKIKEQNYNQVILNNKNMIEKYQNDLDYQIQINEKINEEKEIMQLEIEKYKIELNNNIINQNKAINNIIEENKKKEGNENELKNEIEKLKNNLVQKDEKIKELEDMNMEKEKEKGDDIHFYKKSYEEQKLRVNEEHKLISESLYKLAIHFMTLKDDLQKRINSANSEK